MTSDSVGPLSRPFPVGRITPDGVAATVETSAAERNGLAADLGLPAIHALSARFRLTGTPDRIRVEGEVRAEVEQVCVVSLDPFRSTLTETVEVAFREPDPRRGPMPDETELDMDHDEPEDLAGDSVDLGAITAEFLALGLDPYPRKPGVELAQPEADEGAAADGPFARLAALRPKD